MLLNCLSNERGPWPFRRTFDRRRARFCQATEGQLNRGGRSFICEPMASAVFDNVPRFADWRLAMRSILGFWAVYGLTVLFRAMLGGDPGQVLLNKGFTLLIGIPLTFVVYMVIATVARRSSWRRLALVAAVASLAAASIQSGILIAADRYMQKPQDEVRYVSTEGYKITELGNSTVIERPGQPPLTITWPRINRLDPWLQFRIAADNAVIWLFFFGAWSAFYIALVAQGRAHDLRRQASAAEAAAQAAQVRALRYQVNPHFLFNTLNSLSSLVMTGRSDRAEAMLLALSTFFRTSLSLDPGADVSLAEEIELQKLYLDIEMARFPDRLQVEIDVPKKLEQARLPALILQPIVENAIKYGVSKSRKAVIIKIAAHANGNGDMTVEISNKLKQGGKEELPAATHEGTGVGLANVSQRLYARFGGRASSRFGPMPGGGYKASLTMPVEKHV